MRRPLTARIRRGRFRSGAPTAIAVIALVFAITGGALASTGGPSATTAKHKSVAAQIKAYFKKHKASLTGPRGPAGPTGPPGTGTLHPVVYVVSAALPSGSSVGVTANCPSGQVPTGGGAYDSGDTLAYLYGDGPSPGTTTSGFTPTGWGAQYKSTGGPATTVYVYVLCVPAG